MISKPANQETVPTKVLSLITHPLRETRKGIKEMGTKKKSGRTKRLSALRDL